jgi:predicted SAM-dependent methyltransferase
MKIQFGSGSNILDGWVNTDAEVDVTQTPLPFESKCAERILAEHVLEHISAPQMLRFLDECHRILKPNGVIRICCPVVDDRLTKQHARDLTLGHGHQQILTASTIDTFLWMAGFSNIIRTLRKQEDGHFRVIGIEKDDLETCRMEGTK